MKAYELEAELDGLKGKKISFRGKSGKLIKWELKERILKLTTDQDDISILVEDIDQSLSEIEVIEGNGQHPEVMSATPSVIRSNANNLANILMDNINRVKEDKGFIPQAQEINNSVKSMIDLAKVEVEYMKTIAYMKKQK